VEKKLEKYLGGYKMRADGLRKKMGEAAESLVKARGALTGFKTLAASEEAAIRNRLHALREEVGFISKRGREAQSVYASLREELDGLSVEERVNGHS
jgi:pre-mRNA-splicing factor CDC5/CEF1